MDYIDLSVGPEMALSRIFRRPELSLPHIFTVFSAVLSLCRALAIGLGVAVPPSGAPDISSIQAKVRAQAQAISAALALKIAQGGAAAANPSAAAAPAVPISSSAGGAGAGAGVDKSQLKTLVDRIPTEK